MEKLEVKSYDFGIFGYIIIGWILASFLGFFLVKDSNDLGMLIGQYFFIFGIIIYFIQIKEEGHSWISAIPFMVIGYIVFLNSFRSAYPNIIKSTGGITISETIYVLPFIILGFLILFGPFIRIIYLKIFCTRKVRATVISKIKKDEHSYILCPNYEYNYEHKKYKTRYNALYNLNITHVGKTTNIYVNPNNPEQTLVIDFKSIFAGLILGAAFVFPLIEPIKNLLS